MMRIKGTGREGTERKRERERKKERSRETERREARERAAHVRRGSVRVFTVPKRGSPRRVMMFIKPRVQKGERERLRVASGHTEVTERLRSASVLLSRG